MSHTDLVNTTHQQTITMVQTTIVNYVAGGEAYTAAEFNVDTILGFIIGQVPPAQNSLGVALFPIVGGIGLKLYQIVSGALVEIPTTNNLNAVITALVWSNLNV